MPTSAARSSSDTAGSFLTMVEVPPGATGADTARDCVEHVLGSPHAAFALVSDPVAAASVVQPDQPLEDSRTALVLLTSGSTGDPKGVCWSRENLVSMASMWSERHPDLLDAPRVVALPVTTAGGLGVIIRAVIDEAPIIAVDSIGGACRFTPDVFAAAIRPVAEAGPVVSLVPTQLALLLRDEAGRTALRAMRRVFLGGAATPARLVSEARDLGIDIVTTYGMTETCGGCVHDGRPLDGAEVRVDESGRIHLAGAMCALGYRLRPQDTAAAFTGEAFTTGDVGSWDGHRLTVIGRIDDIVQIRGINVAIGAVERAIIDSGHVRDAVVVPLADDVDGVVLHALAIPDSESEHTFPVGASDPAGNSGEGGDPGDPAEAWTHAIGQSVRRQLGGIAVPRSIRPVSVLPYLPGGKIDRRTARTLIRTDPSPTDPTHTDPTHTDPTPTDPISTDGASTADEGI